VGIFLLSTIRAAHRSLESQTCIHKFSGGKNHVKINSSTYQPGGYPSADACIQHWQYLRRRCGKTANENPNPGRAIPYAAAHSSRAARGIESFQLRHFTLPSAYMVG
jgi:hypothetical protein